MSENDYEVVPELGEHRGEIMGVSDAPNPKAEISRQLNTFIQASGQRFETVFEFLGEGIVLQNANGQIVLANEAASQILGLTHEQLEGRTSTDPRWQALKEDGSPFPGEEHPAMVALRTGERQSDVLMNVLKPDGGRVWIKINSIPISTEDDVNPTSVVTSFCDVTTLKEKSDKLGAKLKKLQDSQVQIHVRRKNLERANRELREVADTDTETGLKNSRCFMERLCSEVALASRRQTPVSMLIGEIQPSNDGYNPDGAILRKLGTNLLQSCRKSDFAARYSVDKFAVILPYSTADEGSYFAERLVSDLEKMSVVVSIGIAEYRLGMLTNEFLEHAEGALFRAKATKQRTCN